MCEHSLPHAHLRHALLFVTGTARTISGSLLILHYKVSGDRKLILPFLQN